MSNHNSTGDRWAIKQDWSTWFPNVGGCIQPITITGVFAQRGVLPHAKVKQVQVQCQLRKHRFRVLKIKIKLEETTNCRTMSLKELAVRKRICSNSAKWAWFNFMVGSKVGEGVCDSELGGCLLNVSGYTFGIIVSGGSGLALNQKCYLPWPCFP